MVEPEQFKKPYTFSILEKFPSSKGIITFWALLVALGLSKSTYVGDNVLTL